MRSPLKLKIYQMKSKNYSENIIKIFRKDGFILSEPDVLLDSDYIIQRSGENFRKLMLTFEDDSGKSMCLRPDLTVASCIKYLKDNSKANSKIFYSGQAYRRSSSPKDKVVNDQLGIEILGSKNKSVDDLKVLKTIVSSIEKIKIKNTSIKVSCGGMIYNTDIFRETLPNGKSYLTSYNLEGTLKNTDKYIVPENHFFFMGDNRDCSKDSRFLGSVGYVNFVNLVGKAQVIFFSNDTSIGSFFKFWKWNSSLRIKRFFKEIK